MVLTSRKKKFKIKSNTFSSGPKNEDADEELLEQHLRHWKKMVSTS